VTRSTTRGVLVLALLALGGLIAARPVAAESTTLARVVKSRKLRVGMSGSQPPFNMKDKSGALMGLDVDLARLLATSMGVELELVTRPFGELLGALKAGDVDLVISGMTITPERNLEVAFVGPYFVSGKSILTKSKTLAEADDTKSIDSPEVSLAALAGSTSVSFVKDAAPQAKLVTVENYDQGVKLVLDDKVDALVADFPICALSVLRHPDQGLTTLVTPLTIEPIGIALPPGDVLLINLVQNYLGALEGTGVLETLRSRWFESGSWVSRLP
jgi:polar amino acid transport system substrate-binding protein